MIEQHPDTGASRGKFWRGLRVSNPVGRPLAEWAYYSPREPTGVTAWALRQLSADVQRETVLLWFLSNYTPYKLGPGPYFGFSQAQAAPDLFNSAPLNGGPLGGTRRNRGVASFSDGSRFSDGSGFAQEAAPEVQIGGFDQAPFAPSRLTAASVLASEFPDSISERVRAGLVDELAGGWMLLEPRTEWGPAAAPKIAAGDLPFSILLRLERLEEELAKLKPAVGGMGHNSRGLEGPLTDAELAKFRETLENAKALVASQPTPKQLARIQAALEGHSARVFHWLAEKADSFVTEAAKSAGKKAGEIIVALIIAHQAKEIAALVGQLAKLATGH